MLVVLVIGGGHVVAIVPVWLLGSRARSKWCWWRLVFRARANPELMLLLYLLCCWMMHARPCETHWWEVVLLLLLFLLLLCVGMVALVVC